jgi:hypothetical protein
MIFVHGPPQPGWHQDGAGVTSQGLPSEVVPFHSTGQGSRRGLSRVFLGKTRSGGPENTSLTLNSR